MTSGRHHPYDCRRRRHTCCRLHAALDAEFKQPRLTVIEPDGNLLVADYEGDFIYRVSPFLPAASAGGSTTASVYYSFDSAARHPSTVRVDTQKPIWTFVYDA
jgi:hypothetical protein